MIQKSKKEIRMADVSRLPGPRFEEWEWQFEGACRTMETEMFFHPEFERGAARRYRAAVAKATCATCPMIEACREYSIEAREPYGIWGGLTEEERRAEIQLRELRRGKAA